MPLRGLSPPTRGNLHRVREHLSPLRSIPAHAGEPGTGRRIPLFQRVYPRPRGGTSLRQPPAPRWQGLSPPTRGNQAEDKGAKLLIRSIPAHAGEPALPAGCRLCKLVYPRPRGGTCHRSPVAGRRRGLSPPTRGNRVVEEGTSPLRRSIPAHAGEPRAYPPRDAGWKVYPRPRGGTSLISPRFCRRQGLSPPTRGNPRW